MIRNHRLGRRHRLKKKEVKKILEGVAASLGNIDLTHLMDSMEKVKISPQDEAFLIDEIPVFINCNGNIFPTLMNKEILCKLPTITVDMGAVPNLCNGADLMAPGVVNLSGEFQVEAITVVVDEKFSKPIALVKTLYSSNDFLEKNQGKVARNIHFVGDKFWKIFKHMKK